MLKNIVKLVALRVRLRLPWEFTGCWVCNGYNVNWTVQFDYGLLTEPIA